eukprot:1507753-Rhodomonas_salina.1
MFMYVIAVALCSPQPQAPLAATHQPLGGPLPVSTRPRCELEGGGCGSGAMAGAMRAGGMCACEHKCCHASQSRNSNSAGSTPGGDKAWAGTTRHDVRA